jgi:hypothetical protein
MSLESGNGPLSGYKHSTFCPEIVAERTLDVRFFSLSTKFESISDHLLSKSISFLGRVRRLHDGLISLRTMLFGCAIIIKRPRLFRRGKKAKAIDENISRSADSLPRYFNTVDGVVSVLREIDSMEIMDESRRMRSAAPSPEPLKETGQGV